MLTLTARFQQTPPDNAGGHQLEATEQTFTAPSYDDALAQARASVREGWRLITVRVDR